ncbi:MAG: GHMP kinase [Verrucomicrobia bacterium CG_4_10_14_3_um_filter_43_23]|nr:MAG: GHMP kinase [Verrucomicrobia bacterium CG1_02_43_26]PIP59026.1 MAG: GHMP kinase [Verrucomicrobia bacterium CG22_combo_CG10-13_8_21_14_all_43_17]PIX59123.1 MAG: GHMP kinase [Verrucomicrobia bacterium CG_4_10_14_3_um_filter_43_23]PIY61355.1 MAG: GHMP kinase [Verrucomicrobia bacterium CG_4_10_14_0_8_um_filter_43_34]PJA44136.1 MAG: GHMP kinase [Verrucomicrobia bacterium CG_4_9_14_3_um_filter_43_20]
MIITQAPLRISFFGGGTDYPEYFENYGGGAVLAAAINKFAYVTASQFPSHLFDYSIRLSYRDVELTKNVADIKHRVFRACLELLGIAKDIELHTVADLPSFTGLGSSSSFTVSLLKALHAYKGRFIKRLDLAYEAIYVERKMLNEAVGCQDQTMAAVGGFNRVDFITEKEIVVKPVTISRERLCELESHLVMVFTDIKRSAQKIASEQIKGIEDKVADYKVMYQMVEEAENILYGNESLDAFGELLHSAWEYKQRLERSISNDDINNMYQKGLDSGAIGGKLLGAGGGGFLLFYIDPKNKQKLIDTFKGNHIIEPKLASPAAQVIYSS